MHPIFVIQKGRFDLCRQCPSLRPARFEKLRRCNECGCFMLAKTHLMWASCPLGKWPAMKPEDIQHVMIASADPEET